MTAFRFIPELAHFTKHGNAFSIRIQFHQRAQSRLHRIWIRIVAVVDELHAANIPDLQPRFG